MEAYPHLQGSHCTPLTLPPALESDPAEDYLQTCQGAVCQDLLQVVV